MHKEEILEENQNEQQEELDRMIREVAEEENMTYEEVKEILDTFRDARKKPKSRNATKKKVSKADVKKKRKNAKMARRKNRK